MRSTLFSLITMVIHTCDYCGYTSNHKSTMTKHIRTHTGEKPFACDQCEYRAAIKSHLARHMRVHTGEKPFACHHCTFRASNKSSLTKHLRTHSDDRPYVCNICGYRSAKETLLAQHYRKHTGHSVRAAKEFLCKYCGFCAASNESLAEHVKEHASKTAATHRMSGAPHILNKSSETVTAADSVGVQQPSYLPAKALRPHKSTPTMITETSFGIQQLSNPRTNVAHVSSETLDGLPQFLAPAASVTKQEEPLSVPQKFWGHTTMARSLGLYPQQPQYASPVYQPGMIPHDYLYAVPGPINGNFETQHVPRVVNDFHVMNTKVNHVTEMAYPGAADRLSKHALSGQTPERTSAQPLKTGGQPLGSYYPPVPEVRQVGKNDVAECAMPSPLVFKTTGSQQQAVRSASPTTATRHRSTPVLQSPSQSSTTAESGAKLQSALLPSSRLSCADPEVLGVAAFMATLAKTGVEKTARNRSGNSVSLN